LSTYQAFNRRINALSEPLKVLVFELITNFAEEDEFFTLQDSLIDSMPIMLAVRGRFGKSKSGA